jgi:hypothetical protein
MELTFFSRELFLTMLTPGQIPLGRVWSSILSQVVSKYSTLWNPKVDQQFMVSASHTNYNSIVY